ncbi:MAG: helix-turn-helix domain-containing protein [Lacunisphaera sp.]
MKATDDIRQKRRLVEQLRRSRVFREYEKAFRDCTGLPLSLRSGECFGLAHQDDPRENPFCALMAAQSRTCSACLAFQERLTRAIGTEPGTQECYAGLSESAVPVRVGEQTVAYLQTGQMLLHRPTPARLRRLARRLKDLGIDADDRRFAAAYTRSRLVPRQQYDAILQLLAIFALQLGTLSSQLIMQDEKVEQPAIARARAYIAEHHTEELTLTEVAGAASMSTYHFCKIFHKSTGLTFTDYVARVRVENVRQRLLNPHTRISEAAYAGGFQSLSQFSRVFRRIVGESPSAFRERLDLAKSA